MVDDDGSVPRAPAPDGGGGPGDVTGETLRAPEGGRRGELERSLGLPAALTIGTGTMIGAGIFVFPGLAAGEAGPAATLSFALGAGIALLVALPASELATAMPRSGGGYFFVSRGLGSFAGTLVGLGQWFGLVFASAFYLVGFGYYLGEVVATLGVGGRAPVVPIAFATAVALAGISLTGTRRSGSLQNWIVGTLLALLLTFLGWGILRAFGVSAARPHLPGSFAPYGVLPVFGTAALVFTSYLGFVQIATVAGEIRDPGRNIPRAMVGSVLLVGVLYVAAIFVATAVFSPERLAALGETALVEVARTLAGTAGAAAFLVGGVLATLSSANASILSSSRAVFALSRDGLVPRAASAVNERFRTPHVALVLAGVPIAALTLMGRVEVLAEVASLLHLIMYGLICIALLAFRRNPPDGYRPSFRCPGHPVLPVVGAVASFGLIAFMDRLSLLTGGGILLLIAGWYVVHAREAELKETG